MDFIKENIEILTQLEKQFPNNMEFGNVMRTKFMDEEFVKNLPNDQDFGKEVRRIIKNL